MPLVDDDRLCLLTVHAHPDDESSKGAGTVARYHAEGVRTVLVCCTGGEEGDILNPAMDKPEVRDNLHKVRMDELARAAAAIGYDEVVMLGYRDSGMADSEANHHPESFAQAPMEEAVGRLVAILRRERPQVVITYNEDQQGYPHPDHIRVHEVTVRAIDAAADAAAYPEAGPPWQVAKTYYSVWSRARILQTHEKMLELGLESPFDEKWFERPSYDHLITAQIEISDYSDVRREALLAHATQIDPESPFWFGLPPEVQRTVHPYDDYVLGPSSVAVDPPEDDLFAGIRQPAAK
jgi:mycothiol S-conjugate amidase